MNKQIKGLVYFYLTNMRHSLIIFWSILLSTILISFIASYLLRDTDGVFMLLLSGPVYIYFSVYGYYIVKNWLPFVIKIGATRKNIFISFALFFTSLATIFSLITIIIQESLLPLARWLDMDIFSFIHLATLLNDTWYERLFIDITVCLFLFVTSFLIGLINYRYGLLISGSFIGLLFLMSMFGMFRGWLIDFFMYIYSNFDLLLFVKVGVVSIAIYVITWLFLRKATVTSVR